MIVEMDVDSINVAPFQPASRMTPGALAALKLQIERVGRIVNPLAVGCDGYLGDGHRRLACAKMLGYRTVPVQVFEDLTSAQIWDIANSATRKISQCEWGQAASLGLPDDAMPASTRNAINEIRRLISIDSFNQMIAPRYSPRSILSFASKIARYCDMDNDGFKAQAIVWLAEYGAQYVARRAMEDGCPPETLIEAIECMQPIRRAWTV